MEIKLSSYNIDLFGKNGSKMKIRKNIIQRCIQRKVFNLGISCFSFFACFLSSMFLFCSSYCCWAVVYSIFVLIKFYVYL